MCGCFDRCCNCTQNKLLPDEPGIGVKKETLVEKYASKGRREGCAVSH